MGTVEVMDDGAVRLITLNRPERSNALDAATAAALHDALSVAGADRSVRAVVLIGAGDRAFCAGLDLAALASGEMPDPTRSPTVLLRDGGLDVPVIAALNGAAVGGGLELALACDLRVAAEHATLALPEVRRGLAATQGGTELPRQIPIGVALELALTGTPMTAARATTFGLVNTVVPAHDLRSTALDLAHSIAANSPAGVRVTRELMWANLTRPIEETRTRAESLTARLIAGPDAAEGAAAFLQRRSPLWPER